MLPPKVDKVMLVFGQEVGVEKAGKGWDCVFVYLVFGQELVWRRLGGNVFIWCLDRKLVWRRLGVNMIMCLSGVWTVGVEKVGWKYDQVFFWCLDRSWFGEGWVGI